MDLAAILVIRPLTTLGVSQLLVLERAGDGSETEVLRRPAAEVAAVTAEIARRIEAGPLAGILVDLEFCDWVDSGTLGVWVSWHHLLDRQGGRVVICRANDRIRNILRISQLDRLFSLGETLADGLDSSRPPRPLLNPVKQGRFRAWDTSRCPTIVK